MIEEKTSSIAVGGLTSALVIICLAAGNFIPNTKWFFMVGAVGISFVPYVFGKVRTGLLIYAAISILSIILIPGKIYAFSYVLLGNYPFFKMVAEGHNIFREFLIKYIWLNLTLAIAFLFVYLLTRLFIIPQNSFGFSNKYYIIAFVAVEIIFPLIDYIFTRIIMFINNIINKGRL